MFLTVLIPTYNRADILEKCLFALEKQNYLADDFEVVVVNDGSTDRTEEVLQASLDRGLLRLSWFYQRNSGQGVARNRGLKQARGDVILFLGDDIIPHPNLLREHVRVHEVYADLEVAVLGMIDWHPDLELNEYMNWMVNGSSILGRFGGHQFAYEKLKRGENPDYNFFYTSNLSLKRDFLGEAPFDEQFDRYGWEDIDLGYRLEKGKGMKLIFNEQARRMELIGQSVHLIHRKHPELRKVPLFWKKFIFFILGSQMMLFGIRFLNKVFGNRFKALYYYALSKKYFLKGLKTGIIYKNI
ncbi:MAG: glycosyltransferase [Candidatus Peregrinibacteria bacterium GW2011_GWE2_39_6]|nr:MAG: glycosyltransferase [Candidatus Peregrinibacteria bacterium GW2011_GWE2_39_6]